jgi:hypothetical protein
MLAPPALEFGSDCRGHVAHAEGICACVGRFGPDMRHSTLISEHQVIGTGAENHRLTGYHRPQIQGGGPDPIRTAGRAYAKGQPVWYRGAYARGRTDAEGRREDLDCGERVWSAEELLT